jgi:hypothetical protein
MTLEEPESGALDRHLVGGSVWAASRVGLSLDAIHLESALRIEADELLAYDRRLVEATSHHGIRVASPGATV